MNKILLFLTSWVIFFVIDMTWITKIMGSFYRAEMGQFFRFQMLPIHQLTGAFVWFLLVLGIFCFILPQANSLQSACSLGLIFGLVVYGVYDLTNFVTINHWSIKLMLTDLAWGCIINSFMSGLIFYLNKRF